MDKAVEESLFFGTGKKDGYVTQEEWTLFLDNTVTPLFPDGLTVTSASGQWKGANGFIIKEPSYVLTLVHFGEKTKVEAIKEIITAYKSKFQQEAVLRVTHSVCISLTKTPPLYQ